MAIFPDMTESVCCLIIFSISDTMKAPFFDL
jgi:hypothetical protein